MFYLRGDEGRYAAPAADRTLGIAVWSAGRRFFFPGATDSLALSLARLALGDALEAPGTRVEWGEVEGGGWRQVRVLKESDEGAAHASDY